MIKLKAKHPDGSLRTVEANPEIDSLSSLKQRIHLAFALPPHATFSLLMGQPPQPLKEDDKEAFLSSLGLHSSQVVLLHHLDPPPPPSATSGRRPIPKKTPAPVSNRPSYDSESSEDYDDEEEDTARKRRQKKSTLSSRPRKKPSLQNGKTGKEQLGEALASAQSVGGGTDPVSRYFRKLTKAHVVKQYEIAAAEAQYAAVLTNKFEIFSSTLMSRRLNSGEEVPVQTKLLIKYQKGPRSFGTEEVQELNQDVLRATIAYILDECPISEDPEDAFSHPRERLRPHLLPMASPRVFWSLVHWYGSGGENCIVKALIKLLPDRDWSFLETRVRLPSALLKASRETEQAFATGDAVDESNNDLQQAVPLQKDRESLSHCGVNSLLELADWSSPRSEVEVEFVSKARQIVMSDMMWKQLFPQSELQLALTSLGFQFPLDVVRWKIPGRREFVSRELKLDLDTVEKCMKHANDLVEAHAWLSEYRTNG